jgi:hypothetical protein
MNVNSILHKRPFARITYHGHLTGLTTSKLDSVQYREGKTQWQCVSQADFLREYYPTGHRINDPDWYHDQIKYRDNEETGEKEFFRQEVFRCALPFQMIITMQQVLHLAGNDLYHELTDAKVSEQTNALFLDYQCGWLEHNMDIAFYEFVKSVKITGDGAIAFYLHKGKVYTKDLSYMNGDTLYAHKDAITGKLKTFARRYMDYDEEGKAMNEFVEVWDDTYMYRYKKGLLGWNAIKNKVYNYFDLDGYVLMEPPTRHGFTRVPIVYKRVDGPAWQFAQDSIDKYEVAMSQLCQNNAAFALPIVLMQGDDIDIQGDIYGNVKGFAMGKEDKVSYLEQDGHSENFKLQLEILLKMIFMGGFAVLPPEVKSGDLPGVAVKLIYAPSLERATIDAKDFDECVDEIKDLFLEGYGVERGQVTQFKSLHVLTYIKPFIFQNENDIVNQLVQCVGSGILSKQTASQKTGFDSNDEWEKIVREQKQEQMAGRLYQLRNNANPTTESEGNQE